MMRDAAPQLRLVSKNSPSPSFSITATASKTTSMFSKTTSPSVKFYYTHVSSLTLLSPRECRRPHLHLRIRY